jgi:KAP family P-loop domain
VPDGLPRIDRIVLYVDDLDRCRTERVVEVLEAVHLLLAMPLFVVVVGVDPRWLLRSLEEHYLQMLRPTGDDQGERLDREWASTPMNYLEKIFQIPFTLRPMGVRGFRALIDSLVPTPSSDSGAKQSTPAQDGEVAGASPEPAQTEAPTSASVASGTPSPAAGSPEPGSPNLENSRLPPTSDGSEGGSVDRPAGGQTEAPGSPGSSRTSPGSRERPPDLNPMALVLEPREIAFIKMLGGLIDTPRSAKRLVNVYRLLRASLDPPNLERLQGADAGPGEYPVALVLLAILIGFPEQASDMFEGIIETTDQSWWAFVESIRPVPAGDPNPDGGRADPVPGDADPAFRNGLRSDMDETEAEAWERLHTSLSRLGSGGPPIPDDMRLYRRWALPVGRYSFQTGRLVVTRRTPPTGR